MTKKILFALPLIAILLLVAAPAFAQLQPPDRAVSEYGSVDGFYKLIRRIVQVLFTLLVILAVVFIMWAAFKYLTAGGNAEQVSEAGKMILYAVVAIAIALLARAVPGLVCSFLFSDSECAAVKANV